MPRATHGLADTTIQGLKPRANGVERIVRDGSVPGLLLRVGKHKRTWYMRVEKKPPVWKRPVPLGTWPQLKADDAREQARALWKRHEAGLPPEDVQPEQPTIETLWPLFEQWLTDEGRSKRTRESYEDARNQLAESVRNKPLTELAEAPRIMREEQARIRKKLANSRLGGTAMATAVSRFASALSNWAVKHDYVNLNGNPVAAAKLTDPKRRDLPVLGPEELPVWWAAVQSLKREQHREAHLFTLLSGLRRESVVKLEWRHLDLKRRCIRIEKPKGGEVRGFDLILSRAMIRCLWRARNIGRRLFRDASEKWVFPGRTKSSDHHIRGDALTKDGLLNVKNESAANHALRRTYATIARGAGVPKEMITTLLNHSGGSDVTEHYIHDTRLGRLYGEAQEDISRAIVRAMGNPRGLM